MNINVNLVTDKSEVKDSHTITIYRDKNQIEKEMNDCVNLLKIPYMNMIIHRRY